MFVEALELFQQLLNFPCIAADEYTYPSALKACGESGRVDYGKKLHGHLVKTGFLSDIFVSSSLATMYSKCNRFVSAEKVFDEIPDRDVRCWNAVISCYYQNGQPEKAVRSFEEMRRAGFEPNSVTYMMIISSCSRLLDLERGKRIHEEVVRNGLVSQGFIRDSLVDMYGKCGCLERAEEVFEQIARKNLIAWNSMLAGYSSNGDVKACLRLLRRMIGEGTRPSLTTFSTLLLGCIRSVQLRYGKFTHGYLLRNRIEPDVFINSLLIDMYFKCGSVSAAENVFNKIITTRKDVVYSNVMIKGYVDAGSNSKALGIYDAMRESGPKPDNITFATVLPACSRLSALGKGKEIHQSISDGSFEKQEVIISALVDMYAKCGALDEAIEVLRGMPRKDIVMWTSVISAYGSHGRALEAIELFEEMKNCSDIEKLDGVAFLSVLFACSHGGLVDQGYEYFNQMVTEHGIKPSVEHYSCLLDLLGRAGRLQEAYQIILRNPEIGGEVDLLSTLLSACRFHNEVDLGVKVARLLIEKNPNDPSAYVILSGLYGSDRKWNELRELRLKMKELGMRKNPGCSWIEIDDKRIYTFFARDDSHPQTETIYECLRFLATQIRRNGSCPSISSDLGIKNDEEYIGEIL